MPVSGSPWPCRGLYAITPNESDTDVLIRDCEAALRGGAALLQYRNKSADEALRQLQGRALQVLCNDYRVNLIVNDDLALAHALGAGVHVGEHDAGVAAARAMLGPCAIVGASCYDDPGRAGQAAKAGASYLAFGAFHSSATKPNARRADPQLLRDAAMWNLPRVAIGGISTDNAPPLIAAGADLVAVVSAVFDAPDIETAVRGFASLFLD